MKKIALVLALVLCLCSFAACGKDADPTKGLTPSKGLEMKLASEIEGLAYENNYVIEGNDYYVVTGIGTCTDTELVVPSEYNGKPVKAIGGFMGNANITKVILPNSIEVIRALAFGRNTSLTYFNMGNGVKIIEHCAFGTCKALTGDNLIISKNAEFIGWECFHHAENLKSINLPKSIKVLDYNLFNGVGFETVNYAGSDKDWAKVDVNSNNAELLDATYNFNAKFAK